MPSEITITKDKVILLSNTSRVSYYAEKAANRGNTLIMCALAVIGILAIANVLPRSILFGGALGLSGLWIASTLLARRSQRTYKQIFDSILAVAFIAISIASFYGRISPPIMGWTMVVPLASRAFYKLIDWSERGDNKTSAFFFKDRFFPKEESQPSSVNDLPTLPTLTTKKG